jgi:hypothetical protein
MDGTDTGVTCVLTSVCITVGYTIDDIGVLQGDTNSRAMDLNALEKRDQVVGISDAHAVLWEHRAAHTPQLLNLERDYCEAAAIRPEKAMVARIHPGEGGSTKRSKR